MIVINIVKDRIYGVGKAKRAHTEEKNAQTVCAGIQSVAVCARDSSTRLYLKFAISGAL